MRIMMIMIILFESWWLIMIMLFQSLSQLIAATHWGYDARKMAIRNSSGYDEASWTSQINKVYINDVQTNQGKNWVFTIFFIFTIITNYNCFPSSCSKVWIQSHFPRSSLTAFMMLAGTWCTFITDDSSALSSSQIQIPKNYLFLKNHFNAKMFKDLSLLMIMTINAQKTQLNFTFIGSSTYATEHFKELFVFKQIIKIKKIKKS